MKYLIKICFSIISFEVFSQVDGIKFEVPSRNEIITIDSINAKDYRVILINKDNSRVEVGKLYGPVSKIIDVYYTFNARYHRREIAIIYVTFGFTNYFSAYMIEKFNEDLAFNSNQIIGKWIVTTKDLSKFFTHRVGGPTLHSFDKIIWYNRACFKVTYLPQGRSQASPRIYIEMNGELFPIDICVERDWFKPASDNLIQRVSSINK